MLIKNLFRYWTYQVFSPGTVLREKYESFKTLLELDKAAHDAMATLEEIYYSQTRCDFQVVVKTYDTLADSVSGMVEALLKMCPSNHWSLRDYFKKFDFYNRFILAPPEFDFSPPFTMAFKAISTTDKAMAGTKAATLSLLANELNLPTPDGFVITTNAFHYFLEYNNLRKAIDGKLANLDIHSPTSLDQTVADISQMILTAIIPDDIMFAVGKSVKLLEKKEGGMVRVALRSSAGKEDGKASFAGQYQTLLNLETGSVLDGYKQVIAGKYSAQALYYRISRGILDSETPMAVLVLGMVDAVSSGVMYTRDPEQPLADALSIHSVWGQGGLLVDGQVEPDTIRVSRENPTIILETTTATKHHQMVLEPENQTRTIAADSQKKRRISLDYPSALTLARWGLFLETHFDHPQDIEWCQDKNGSLFILQSRPLNMHITHCPLTGKRPLKIENTILCSGGQSASGGVGSGPVYRLDSLSQLPHIPPGSVVVVRHASPRFVRAIDKMSAIIIGSGSKAGHFSSIAREFRVPAIVNIDRGFEDLIQDNWVTVDAHRCIVYEGEVGSLMEQRAPGGDVFGTSPFMSRLKFVMDFSATLKLTDPESSSFAPEGCRSLHDIIRFVHETAVKEMFFLGNRRGGRKKGAKKLISSLPMLFYVLDVGRGIDDRCPEKTDLKPEEIKSRPMIALLKGLSNPGICWDETTHFDWEAYDRIVMAGGIINADSPRFGSYAVMSANYLNVNFRFGYHFAILDTICSLSEQDNHILFRFSGGGGSPGGRALRAAFIRGILVRLGFMVDVKLDLVDAEFRGGSLQTIEHRLDILGRLLGATKLMDIYLKQDLDMEIMIDDFMNERYDFRTIVR